MIGLVYNIEALTVDEIVKATGGTLVCGNGTDIVNGISIDSRTLESTTLFIPIKGENFDGHTFIEKVKDVCAGYLTEQDAVFEGGFCIKVESTKKALLDLASYYRSKFEVTLVGVTGSVGKTTTKEFIYSVLSEHGDTLKTEGNFNNEIGLPLTLFGLRKNHKLAVIEMGMSNFGEIERLSKCAKPDIAVITNIGTSHIEYLGSQEGILKAKLEILKGLKPGGKLIVNGDDEFLSGEDVLYDRIMVGIKGNGNQIVAKDLITDDDGVEFIVDNVSYRINIMGTHNVYNALIAIAIGRCVGMDVDAIKRGLAKFHADGIRQNIIRMDKCTIVNDCYNASPQSMCSSLDVLKCISKNGRKIAVLGDMKELGEKSPKYHYDVGAYAPKSASADVLVLIGEHSQHIADGALAYGLTNENIHIFETNEDIIEFLKAFVEKGDSILVKGSRAMKLEVIAEELKKYF